MAGLEAQLQGMEVSKGTALGERAPAWDVAITHDCNAERQIHRPYTVKVARHAKGVRPLPDLSDAQLLTLALLLQT